MKKYSEMTVADIHRRLAGIHKSLDRLMARPGEIEGGHGWTEDDVDDIEQAVGYLSRAQLNIYYASRQFEGGNCDLLDRWKTELEKGI